MNRYVLFALLAIPWLATELLYPRRTGAAIGAADRGSSVGIALGALATVVATPVLLVTGWGGLPATLAGVWPVGAALALAGTALRWWAIRTLGARFTSAVEIQPDHAVSCGGPFAWLRHPGYAGCLAWGVGEGLVLGNGAAVGVFLATYGVAVWYRIRVEERALAIALGDPYTRYAARVRCRLLPPLF